MILRLRHIITLLLVLIVVMLRAPQASGQSTLSVGDVQFEFVRVQPGKFARGSNEGDGDERPVHKVTIDYSFDIGKTEVTVGQFKAFVEATGYKTDAELHAGAWLCPCPDQMGGDRKLNWRAPGFEQTENHPVVCISYNDAKALCKWLSQQTRQNFRLPTEAEWEHACRAGTTGDFAGEIRQMAWFDMTSQRQTHPIAQKKHNPWGLYDMHGNVWEWCEDIYHWHYRNAPNDGSANTKPDVPAEAASRRVLRGGAWCRPGPSCTSSFRYPAHSAFRDSGTGFRIIRCSKPPAGKPKPAVSSAKKSRKSSARDRAKPSALTLTIDSVNFSFVRIDPGKFVMGSPSVYVDATADMTYELPAHEVTIAYSYYMSTTEVTLEQFELFVEDTGYVTDAEKHGWALLGDLEWRPEFLSDFRFPGFVQTDADPVTHINYYDAVAFCQWLSEKSGRDIRLPTEAEWEYACRAGTTGQYAGDLYEMGWHRWNSHKKTYPVAQKKPNPWGLYDMHGNVWEWVQDMWHDDANGAPTDGSAWLDSIYAARAVGVTRGGSFGAPPWLCRSYSRMWTTLETLINRNNGFRLAMEVCD